VRNRETKKFFTAKIFQKAFIKAEENIDVMKAIR
jgi:hypothetical protein